MQRALSRKIPECPEKAVCDCPASDQENFTQVYDFPARVSASLLHDCHVEDREGDVFIRLRVGELCCERLAEYIRDSETRRGASAKRVRTRAAAYRLLYGKSRQPVIRAGEKDLTGFGKSLCAHHADDDAARKAFRGALDLDIRIYRLCKAFQVLRSALSRLVKA